MVVPDDATTPHGESLDEVIEKLALVHDFGKATTWFQQYIGVMRGQPNFDAFRYHAPLGSFAAYYVLRESGYESETCLAGFVSVAKHHGRLPDVAEYVFSRTKDVFQPDGTQTESQILDPVKHQVHDIHENAPDLAEDLFQEVTNQTESWKMFAKSCVDSSLFEEIASYVSDDGVTTFTSLNFISDEFYGLVLSCWGTLVLADKTSAAGAQSNRSVYESVLPQFDTLEQYIHGIEADADADADGTREEQLNYFRSAARDDVLESISEFVERDENVCTLTLPTGMGKTLTGLSAALAIRDATESKRVVYALPFTSIIDQVAGETAEIFDSGGTDGLLATHHHLAETRIDATGGDGSDADAADRSDDVAGMLGESWRAGLTVTTFVQLFESLTGPRNTQSMKVPALRDSVLVLDEPQSLPLDWWKLVPRLVDVLTEQYGATVIAMTATQPELFPEAVELVDDVDKYFQIAERVQYRLHSSVERHLNGVDEPLDYETAATELAEDVRMGTATLAICNTIDSARRLTETLTDRLETVDVMEEYIRTLDQDNSDPVAETVRRIQAADKHPFVHLSTRLRPADRLALVRIIKQLRRLDVQVAAVTTQLVEAGVDVSFEAVYRDLAPVDSIVQAAGRCNRSFEQDHGTVTVWWLDAPDEQTKTPAVAVYDRGTALTPVTAAALDFVRSDEPELTGRVVARDAVTDYYRRLHADKDVGRENYVELVDSADGDGLASLSLIDAPRAIDVIVCLSAEDDALVDNLETAYEDYEFDRVRRLLDETKPLRVSVPIYDQDSREAEVVTNLPPLAGREEEAEIRVLRSTSPTFEKHFDSTLGFVVPEATVEDRFL